jgi:hypothetical protein
MNDVIQAVGPHKNKHGERCEVKHIDQGIAFGFDSDGDPAWWRCADGNWQGAGDDYRLHIVGPWIEPKPFSISEHGPGVYETREGKETTVIGPSSCSSAWHRWQGRYTYGDTGGLFSSGQPSCFDLVRYLRPLPKPEPQEYVSKSGPAILPPQPEWTPTNHYQQTTIVDGCEWTSRWYGKPPSAARIEQRWTNGTEEEWRPVPTTTEGT